MRRDRREGRWRRRAWGSRRHGAALVFADTAQRRPYAEDLTADFAYLRLHGAEHLYASGYTDPQLDWWAERDVYVYFDNDARVQAPFDAMRLAERLRG